MADDVPLIDRDEVATLLVTIDVMQLVKIYGHGGHVGGCPFVLWSCRLCEEQHSDSAPGVSAALWAIGHHMATRHGVQQVRPVSA